MQMLVWLPFLCLTNMATSHWWLRKAHWKPVIEDIIPLLTPHFLFPININSNSLENLHLMGTHHQLLSRPLPYHHLLLFPIQPPFNSHAPHQFSFNHSFVPPFLFPINLNSNFLENLHLMETIIFYILVPSLIIFLSFPYNLLSIPIQPPSNSHTPHQFYNTLTMTHILLYMCRT